MWDTGEAEAIRVIANALQGSGGEAVSLLRIVALEAINLCDFTLTIMAFMGFRRLLASKWRRIMCKLLTIWLRRYITPTVAHLFILGVASYSHNLIFSVFVTISVYDHGASRISQ